MERLREKEMVKRLGRIYCDGGGRGAVNLAGEQFGDLTVEVFSGFKSYGTTGRRRALWGCRCICGKNLQVWSMSLLSGHTKSCGCVKNRKPSNLRHGLAHSPTWRSWVAMRSKRSNIAVDSAWQSFEVFLADMGERPVGMTLDRKDNSKGYSKGNCRWATKQEQIVNRTNTKYLTFAGETLTLAEWARRIGISYGSLTARIRNGWTVERALSTQDQSRIRKHRP